MARAGTRIFPFGCSDSPFRLYPFPNIVCVLNYVLPCNSSLYHIFLLLIRKQDRLQRSLNALRCPYFC